MVVFIVCFVATQIFVFSFLKQIFGAVFFVISSNKKTSKQAVILPKKTTNQVVKKHLLLSRKKILRNLQTKPFFAKFLYNKECKHLLLCQKFLMNNIYEKLSKNVCQFGERIDFARLKCSGLLYDKPVFLIYAPKEENRLNNLIVAIKEVKKHIPFQPILVYETVPKVETEFKEIVLQDFNLKLFQELNKINLNYNFKFNKKIVETKEDFVASKDTIVKRVVCLNENNKNNLISYLFKPKKNEKIEIYIKLKSHLFNIKKEEKGFCVEYFNGEKINYYCNKKIIKINSLKINQNNFLLVKINSQKNAENTIIAGKNEYSFKQLLLKEKIELNKKNNIKIFTKNKIFNNFFNYKLPQLINLELHQKNYLENLKIKYNKIFLSEFLGINYKDVPSYPVGYVEHNKFLELN